MCDEADGACDIWERGPRKARKVHTCDGCQEEIAVGQTYYRTSTLYDGMWSSWKHCERCDALFYAIHEANRKAGWYVSVDPRLDCGESWEVVFGPTPDHVQALAFWLPGDSLPASEAIDG